MQNHNPHNFRRTLAISVIVLGSLATLVASTGLAQRADPEATRADLASAERLSRTFRQVAEQTLPSVVTIEGRHIPARRPRPPQGPDTDPFEGTPFEGTPFEEFFRREFRGEPFRFYFFDDGAPQISMGSGVIIDREGWILTNNHVVSSNGELTVRLSDGREFPVTEIKTDRYSDLAVVHIEGAGALQPARLGDSDQVQVGDWVLAVGNPFGWEMSVTAGIISARGRSLGMIRGELLQTDAAINRGNSGGPLITLDGKVVGINTAISTQTGGYQGVGFAIPINTAKWVARELIEQDRVRRAYLGIHIQPVENDLAKQFGAPVGKGALAAEVMPDTPAAEAGVQRGDVVIELAGKEIQTPGHLQTLVEQSPIGSQQELVVIRDGKRTTLRVTIREMPDTYLARAEPPQSDVQPSPPSEIENLGIEVTNLTAEVAEQLRLENTEGVVITSVEPGSPAHLAGLRNGMVITEVARQPVRNVEEFRRVTKEQSLAEGILLLIRGAQGTRFVVIQAQR